MKTIEIEISKTGEMKVEAHGFTGTSCQQATAELLQKMGAEATSDEAKPEMFSTTTGEQQKAGL